MSSSEKVITLLRSLLDRRERDQAPARPARVLGRHEDGTERLQRTDAACVTRAPRDNHYTGTVVLSPSSSFVRRTGSTGIATITEAISSPTLWVESLDPSDYRPGQSYTVTVIGRGFDERVRIEFLEPPVAGPIAQGQTINEDITVHITVHTTTVVDPETLFLEITVRPGARLYPQGAPISYGRI
jgi:hypothetical protein